MTRPNEQKYPVRNKRLAIRAMWGLLFLFLVFRVAGALTAVYFVMSNGGDVFIGDHSFSEHAWVSDESAGPFEFRNRTPLELLLARTAIVAAVTCGQAPEVELDLVPNDRSRFVNVLASLKPKRVYLGAAHPDDVESLESRIPDVEIAIECLYDE